MKRVFLVMMAVLALAVPAEAQYVTRTSFTITPPATPATLNGSGVLQPFDVFHSAEIVAVLQGNTGGPLDIYLQTSYDGGTTWCDYIHYTQVGAGVLIKYRVSISKTAVTTAVPTQCFDAGLGAGQVLGGEWGDRFRLKAVSGASTTASFLQTIFITFSP
jgi:hypothetical protein